MSKLVEHAAYIEQDPNDTDSIYFVLKVGMTKAAVEAGGIETAASAKGWDETGSPCEHLRLWLVGESLKAVQEAVTRQVRAAKIEEGNAIIEATLAALMPPQV